MKRFNLLLASVVTLLSLSISAVSAAPVYWNLSMNKPAETMNSRSFNIQYTVLSTENDSFTVELFQNGTVISTQNTSVDPNAYNGNSGTFSLSGVADGEYSYYVRAVRDSSEDTPQTTAAQSVRVDATAPGAPIYQGKVRSGNTYTVSFTAPSTSDVTQIRVFSSTGTQFTANSSTQVGVVNVTPGQSASFTYTASSDTERFHAVQAFDGAGNGSSLTGDPNVVATPAQTFSTTSTVGSQSVATTTQDSDETGGTTSGSGAGEVQGTDTAGDGQVSSTGANTGGNGDVLGAEKKDADTVSNTLQSIGLGLGILIVIGAALYYWFVYRTGNSRFNRQ